MEVAVEGKIEAPIKKTKKLSKDLVSKPGTVIITVKGGAKKSMEFDFSKLSPKIQKLFGPFGLAHKLGDAAASRSSKDAEEAIQKVWDGLLADNWSVRAPAVPKVSVTDITQNFAKLSPAEQQAAKGLLAGLGIELPGSK